MADQQQIINHSIVAEAKELMGDRFPMMIKYFIEDTETYMLEINAGIANNNAEQALGPAHTIKSSAKQLGAERVSEIARQIEALCREIIDNNSNDYTKMASLYQALKKEIETAAPELNKLC